jgi:hypothetical protein
VAVEVPLRKEITDYQMKVIGRASIRNIVWGAVAVGCVVGSAALSMLLKIPPSVSSWVFIFIGVPAMLVGFWRPKNGQAPEKYLIDLTNHFFRKNCWTYKSESPYLVDEYLSKTKPNRKDRRRIKRIKEACHGQR